MPTVQKPAPIYGHLISLIHFYKTGAPINAYSQPMQKQGYLREACLSMAFYYKREKALLASEIVL